MKLPRLFLAVLAILAVFLLTPSVQASFPGANGRIVFVSLRDDPIGDIYTMDPDGTNLTRLTNNSVYDDVPVWSPNMTKIAFIRTVGAASDIFVMNADGTNQMNLTSHAAHDTYPAWSPDGTKIVFSSDRDTVEGLYELYTMNAADGTNVTRLTNNSAYDDTADWSPDGTKIAFQSFRDSNYEVYVMNADGTNQTNCTSNSASDGIPSWSPDGTRIAFYSERDNNQEIYVMNSDCTTPTNISNDPGQDYYSVWSPDGTKITFTTERLGPGEIFVMNADGTNQVNITNHSDWDRNPDWGRVPPPSSQISALSPARIWVGLKNSDAVGIKFDLLAEVYKDNTLVSSGQVTSVPGGSSGFNNAKLNTIPFSAFAPVNFPLGSQLKIRLSVRNTCTGPTHNSGTARLWFNDSAANSRFDATIGSSTNDYFLRDGFLLATTAGPGPKKTIDVAAGAPCSAFKPFGTWTITL